mmetsp:Transcript_48983/g.56307  ORF Transcript_48983/g.56307 Transcript_48983/m.56307 type:complete len:104 (+) Transcript_48983:413-724(+)
MLSISYVNFVSSLSLFTIVCRTSFASSLLFCFFEPSKFNLLFFDYLLLNQFLCIKNISLPRKEGVEKSKRAKNQTSRENPFVTNGEKTAECEKRVSSLKWKPL